MGLHLYSECAQVPLYPGSNVTLLQAVASQFLWFSSNPGISKESLSHQFTVEKYLLPANNVLLNNYEEAFTVIKPFLVNTISFHACPNDCVLFKHRPHPHHFSCLNECPNVGPIGTQVRIFPVSTFCIYCLYPPLQNLRIML